VPCGRTEGSCAGAFQQSIEPGGREAADEIDTPDRARVGVDAGSQLSEVGATIFPSLSLGAGPEADSSRCLALGAGKMLEFTLSHDDGEDTKRQAVLEDGDLYSGNRETRTLKRSDITIECVDSARRSEFGR
jgi:hypothetical protein